MINRVYGIRNYKLLEFSWYITTVKFCSVLLEEHPKTDNQKLKKKKITHCITSKLHFKGWKE